tara:strand:+ start:1043 stop:2419 length:1377 start_codon:yes stop_codon:yes gene_type:complete
MADVASSTTALTDAISQLNAETDGLIVKFGEMSDQSKVWTIASRILSGSGLWKLQNRIRALGQTINVFNDANNKALENQMKQMEANQKLSKTMMKLKKEYTEIGKSDYFKAMKKGLMDKGYTEKDAGKIAKDKIQAQYSQVQSGLQKRMKSKAGWRDFMEHGQVQELSATRGMLRDKRGRFTGKGITGVDQSMKKAGFGGYTMNMLTNSFKKMKWTGEIMLQGKFRKKAEKVNDWFRKKMTTLGKFLDVGLSFLLKMTMGLLLLTFAVMILRKIYPKFRKALDQLGGLQPQIDMIWKGAKQIFGGIWTMLKGVFEGDFGKVWKGFKKVAAGLFNILVGTLIGLGKLVVAALWGLGKTIVGAIRKRLPKWLGGKATGGLAPQGGGMALVGERGPELVSLPGGARVHSNNASQRMMGNTINVHVNGRVGASDAEIRDIARKVAREIGIQMNRTSSAVGRF